MKKNERQDKPDYLRRIKVLRLIDDLLMNVCFDGFTEGTQLVLNVILDRDNIKVIDSRTQKQFNNLHGRSIRLDNYAEDVMGAKYDIEIQRENKGAKPRRARYHSSMVDADMLKEGEAFADLHDNYVIFITENDVFGLNKPAWPLPCSCPHAAAKTTATMAAQKTAALLLKLLIPANAVVPRLPPSLSRASTT